MKVFNFQTNAAVVALLVVSVAGPVFGQTLLSQYKFDGDLTNSSTFMDTNGTLAPDGTYRTGTDSATAAAGTPTFTTGVDGTPNGAIVFDGNSGEGGSNGWVDITTAGHPGAPIGLQGTPTDDDPFASNGPGLVSGTAMAWVKSTNTAGARWIMGNLNANPSPPFVFDTQAWLMGWSGSALQVFPRASGPGSTGVQRFIVSDPTGTTDWADDEWHHVAFRWNGGAEQGNGTPEYASVFLDGVNLGAAATNFFLDPTDTQNAWQFPMAIGARNNRGTLDGFFDGAIDDLRIYSDFLSDQ
ncbi:MAG: LamG-like jellyroll fold domain-containing protein, partial [Lacipirellulaceae bacterium]